MKQTKEMKLINTLDNYTEELYNQVYALTYGNDDEDFNRLSLEEMKEIAQVISETLEKLSALNK